MASYEIINLEQHMNINWGGSFEGLWLQINNINGFTPFVLCVCQWILVYPHMSSFLFGTI